MADVAIIGAGSWGIALAKVLHTNGNKVTVWSIVEDEITMLKEKHEHAQKLPGVKLPEDMEFTTDLESAVSGKAYLILAVPSVFTRSTAKSMAPFVKEGQIIVCVAKGIEEETLMPLTDIVEQEIPQAEVAVMCGPSHAEEVGIGLPTTVVAGAKTCCCRGNPGHFYEQRFPCVYKPGCAWHGTWWFVKERDRACGRNGRRSGIWG